MKWVPEFAKGFVAKNAAIMLLLFGISKLLGFIITILLTRSLGPEDYGIYANAEAWLVIMGIVALLGIPMLLVREIAAMHSRREADSIAAMRRMYRRKSMSSSVVIMLMGMLLATVFFHDEPATLFPMFILFLTLPFRIYSNISAAVLRGYKHIAASQTPEQVILPACMLSFISAALLIQHSITIYHAVLFAVLSMLVCMIVYKCLLRKAPCSREVAEISDVKRTEWRLATRNFWMIDISNAIRAYIPIVIIGILASKEETAFFVLALKLVIYLLLGDQILSYIICPLFSENRDSTEKLKRLYALSATMGTLFALPFLLLYFSLGETIIALLFGQSYTPTAPLLMMLSAAYFIALGLGPAGELLSSIGHDALIKNISLITSVMLLVLCCILIPLYGVYGAAIATSAIVLLHNMVISYYAWKQCRVMPSFLGFWMK